MSRQRMTWAPSRRRASEHPATPWEGASHPAAYPDPEADQYENGDTSSWGEDVHMPPYRTSPAPAMPVDDGGYRHPATQEGAPAKNASMSIRASVHRKAYSCVQVAAAMLGGRVASAAERGDKRASDLIQNQALDLMDLPNTKLASILRRIEATNARRAGEADAEAEDEADEAETASSKKASERMLRRMLAEEGMTEGDMLAANVKRNCSPSSEQAWGSRDSQTTEYDELYNECYYNKVTKKAGEAEDDADEAETAASKKASERMLRRMLAEEGMDEADADAGEAETAASKKAFARLALRRRRAGEADAEAEDEAETSASKKASARLLAKVQALKSEVRALKAGNVTKASCGDMYDEESMLSEMMSEAGGFDADDVMDMDMDDDMDMDMDDDMSMGMDDDMGMATYMAGAEDEDVAPEMASIDEQMDLMDTAPSEEDEALLASLFAGRTAGEEAAEEEEEEEKPAAKTAAKTATLRPQPKRASSGAKSIGQISRVASGGGNELNELARMWQSAPDVSKVFGN